MGSPILALAAEVGAADFTAYCLLYFGSDGSGFSSADFVTFLGD